jgi:H+/Cl- antiporter ClcA
MRYEVKVGKDLPLHNVEIEEKRRLITELVRSTIAIAVIGASMLALLCAAAVGVYRGDFSPLLAVWSVVGPMLGLIVGHYFRGAGRGDNEDNPSTA